MPESEPRAFDVLAHRGLWKMKSERNQPAALEAALRAGFGVETDVRDARGALVISHDSPNGSEQRFEEFLDCYVSCGAATPLAINIKADGLASAIKQCLEYRSIDSYFCFDMSIPDMLEYIKIGVRIFVRRSEYEPRASLETMAAGIWLDGFESVWFRESDVIDWLARGLDVCIVSPELHGRDRHAVRELVQSIARGASQARGRLMVCTDFPHELQEFCV